MSKRKIVGLRSVTLIPPHSAPFKNKKSKGARQAGIIFERRFGDYLSACFDNVLVGPWFRYEDENGSGLCQPDMVLLEPLVIFECKLKYKARAGLWDLRDLYQPIVEHFYESPAKLVQVCKHLTPSARTKKILQTLDELTTDFDYGVYQWRMP